MTATAAYGSMPHVTPNQGDPPYAGVWSANDFWHAAVPPLTAAPSMMVR